MLQLPKEFETYSEVRQKGFVRMHELKKQGKKVVGTFCTYTPSELIMAAGAVPVGLCASGEEGIQAAESRLPKNLCPLIKASYGLALTDKCPYFYFSDAIVGETTCDGKKKMYEYLSELKPMHVMQLPPGREAGMSLSFWREEMFRLKSFLEEQLQVEITEEKLRLAIAEKNQQRQALLRLYEVGKLNPCPVSGYELSSLAESASFMFRTDDIVTALDKMTNEQQAAFQKTPQKKDTRPRVMITGCPIIGVREKIVKQAEELGASVVAFDSCNGPRANRMLVDEDPQKDPYLALAEKYLAIDCSVMSPNPGRFEGVGEMIKTYEIDAVIDVVLQACHTFAVEASAMKHFVREEMNLPYLCLETDYSETDLGQINTRIGALLEVV